MKQFSRASSFNYYNYSDQIPVYIDLPHSRKQYINNTLWSHRKDIKTLMYKCSI